MKCAIFLSIMWSTVHYFFCKNVTNWPTYGWTTSFLFNLSKLTNPLTTSGTNIYFELAPLPSMTGTPGCPNILLTCYSKWNPTHTTVRLVSTQCMEVEEWHWQVQYRVKITAAVYIQEIAFSDNGESAYEQTNIDLLLKVQQMWKVYIC
jgi:hypothetical protein